MPCVAGCDGPIEIVCVSKCPARSSVSFAQLGHRAGPPRRRTSAGPARSPCAAGGRRRRRGRGGGGGSGGPGSRSRRGRTPRARTSSPPGQTSHDASGATGFASSGRSTRDPHVLVARQRVEVDDGLEARLLAPAPQVVDAAEVEEEVVPAAGIVAQEPRERRPVRRARPRWSAGRRSTTSARPASGDAREALAQLLGRGREAAVSTATVTRGCSAANRAERLSRDFSPAAIFFCSSHDPVDQLLGRRRAAGHVDVDRDDLVDPLRDVVRAVEAARGGADAHRDDPLGLGHLVVDLAQDGRHLVGDRAGDDQQVRLPRREPHDLGRRSARCRSGTTTTDMNSMPQQAVANGKGQSEFLRAQETISSRRVTKKSAPPGAPGPRRLERRKLALLAEQTHRARFYSNARPARDVRGQPKLTV